jgi:hypothetical protein
VTPPSGVAGTLAAAVASAAGQVELAFATVATTAAQAATSGSIST